MNRSLNHDAVVVLLLFSAGCCAGACYYGWPAIVAWTLGLLLTGVAAAVLSGWG